MKIVRVFICMVLVPFLSFSQDSRQGIVVVCDDKENPPYLTGDETAGSGGKHGSLIEFIRAMEADLDIDVEIIREPLGTAIATSLNNGQNQMIFCLPWSFEAGQNLVFPMENGKPDERYSLYATPFVIYKPAGSALDWDSAAKKLTHDGGKSVGIAFGSEIMREIKDSGFSIKSDFSSTLSALLVMSKGGLAGVIARESSGDKILAGNAELSAKISKIREPILTVPYYVAFSRPFAEKNTRLTKAILEYVKTNRSYYKKLESWYLNQR